MNSQCVNVVVIGGGPAGAGAAIALAQQGRSVRLLERKPGPHHKVCGEFISWEAAEYLQMLGVDLPALGAQPIRNLRLCSGKREVRSALPFTGWSLTRRELDAALLARAEQVGVDVRRGVNVRALQQEGGTWQLDAGVLAQDGASGAGATASPYCRAQTVFLASGKHDLRHWRRQSPSSQLQIGLKMQLRLQPLQQQRLQETVEIHLFEGGYAGLEPVEGGVANLCFLINKDVYRACNKQWPRVLKWLQQASPGLKRRLFGAEPLWPQPLAVAGVPYGYLCPPEQAKPELYRLGDQTAVIPSLAGDGIAIALHSAHLAARMYCAGEGAGAYQRQAYADFRQPVRDAQRVAQLLNTSPGRALALVAAQWWPGLLNSAISRLRVEKARVGR